MELKGVGENMELTESQQMLFNLLNKVYWVSIKPHVKDEEEYKKAMSTLFMLFKNADDSTDKFSDEWWRISLESLQGFPNHYIGTEYEDFVADLAIGLCDVWEYERRGKTEYMWITKAVSKAYFNEWERLRSG